MPFLRHVSIDELITQNILHINKYSAYSYLFDHMMLNLWKIRQSSRFWSNSSKRYLSHWQ